jgi:hypothetical protein
LKGVDKTMTSTYFGLSDRPHNSFETAWNLLLTPECDSVRRVIATDEAQLDQFRLLVENAVQSTDGARLTNSVPPELPSTELIHLIMQASKVVHAMQHWHIYCKWNERLFHEAMAAYYNGQHQQDPMKHWYQEELNFFDSIVIPVADQLKTSGFFDASIDEVESL